MLPSEPTPIDDQVLAALLAEDEALERGHAARSPLALGTTVTGAPPGLGECLRLLERVWPRGEPGTGSERAGPWRLGRFEVQRELGRGGFGIVYLAHDPVLGRRVALKVPSPAVLLSPTMRARFLREARAAGGLDHPNIVPVYEAGEDGALCYIAATYCPGPTLSGWLKERSGPVPARLAARLAATMAGAVQHAHDRNVLHRDIKPSNVLVHTGPGSTDPSPRLTDFGLARATDAPDSGDATLSGTPIGSPPYMAPEQAAGRGDRVGPATDVYGLGATLYEMLTGRPPFRGENQPETLRLVVETDPVPPRQLRPGLPRDLETICLKCLEKEPAHRYATARALADDLGRFLDGRPIEARRINAAVRLRKAARRHPGAAAAIGLLLVAAAVLIGVGAWTDAWLHAHNLELERQFDRADRHAREADRQRHLAERHAHAARLRLAAQALEHGQVERAQEILAEFRPDADGDPRDFAWRHLWAQSHRAVDALGSAGEWYSDQRLAADGRTLISLNKGGSFLIWDVPGNRRRAAGRAPAPLHRPFAVAPDGQSFAAIELATDKSRPRRIWVWNTDDGHLLAEWHAPPGETPEFVEGLSGGRYLVESRRPGLPGVITRICDPDAGIGPDAGRVPLLRDTCYSLPSPDGRRIAAVDGDRLVIFDSDGNRLTELDERPEPGQPFQCSFSADGRVAVSHVGARTTFWDLATARPIATIDVPVDRSNQHRLVSPDARTIVAVSREGTIRFYDRDLGPTHTVNTDSPKIIAAFAPDGRRLAVSIGDHPVAMFDVATARPIDRYPGRRDTVAGLQFTPDGRSLVICGPPAPRVWHYDRATQPVRTGHADETWALAFSPDGRLLAGGSDDTDEPKTLKLWDAATGRRVAGWHAHPATVSAVAFHPSGCRLASAGLCDSASVRIWDVPTGEFVAELAHPGRVRAVAYSPDGRTLASAGNDRVVRLWEPAGGRLIRALTGHEELIRTLSYSPDGRTLASAGHDRTIRLWDPATGRLGRTLSVGSKVAAIAFSPDGNRLAAADENGSLTVWDPADGARLLVIRGDDELRALAWTPDGRAVATAGASKAVRLWDVLTGQELLSLSGHDEKVNALAFTPDARILASGDHAGAVLLWRAEREE